MAVSTSPDNQSVNYRYFVCDLMTNNLLAEIPFRGVSYSRSLTEAGTFTGDIAVTEDTYNLNLYENTLPAKTALYVVRNGVCVWGGIIWGRTYSLIDKVLSVTAAEFPSYLSRRVVWKTWNSAYEASVTVENEVATITLKLGQYPFSVGEVVWVDWGKTYAKYNGYFTILTTGVTTEDSLSFFTTDATYIDSVGTERAIPDMATGLLDPDTGEETFITVETRQDTYNYARDLINELKTDLFDFDFANDDIRPGVDLFNEIQSVSRSGNIATVVLTKKHELVVGQKIAISDVEVPGFNDKEATVRSIINDKSFTYDNSGSNVGSTTVGTFQYIVQSFKRNRNIAEYTTTTAHQLGADDIVFINDVSETFDGFYRVYDTPTTTTFRVVMQGSNIALSNTDTTGQKAITGASGNGTTVTFTCPSNGFVSNQKVKVTNMTPSSYNGIYTVVSANSGSFTVSSSVTQTFIAGGTAGPAATPTVTRRGAVTYGTYGEHTTLGDLGFDLSQSPLKSQKLELNPIIRGFELKTVAEILEEYSSKPNGFEYRIDCEYDAVTNKFKKYFKFLPLIPQSLTDYLDSLGEGWSGDIPASAYGAQNLIFEYPGNILEAQFEENAEEAATRVFVKGKDSNLNSEASQPYSSASNHKLLNQGWPIIDDVDDLDSPDETVLWKQAARLLEESVPPISTFTISVNGSSNPTLGSYKPGDWCSVKLNDDFVSLRADSYLEQDYGTDSGVLVRKIISYSVTIPDTPSYPEEVSLDLVTEPSIPISGIIITNGKALLQ